MAKILDGKIVRDNIKEELREKVSKLSFKPCLAIVQVGDREDSNVYIRQKVKFGEEIGVGVKIFKFQFSSFKLEEELTQKIQELNADQGVHGIIVQLPLPSEIDENKILSLIKKEKDPEPATARAVVEILDYYGIEVEGKKSVVIGQGIIAGRPIADELERRGAQVVRCDVSTPNIPEIARTADILVSAVGKPGLVGRHFTNEKQVVIDVGITKVSKVPFGTCKILGDVAFEEVEPYVAALTPVPGGVGPVTVASLFKNLLDLACPA